MSSKKGSAATSSNVQRLMFSGIACSVAEMATFWIDSLKVRRQVVGELGGKPQGSLSLLKGMGVTGAYQGISAALLRQVTYGSARYGIFMPIKEALSTPEELASNSMPFWKKVVAGTLAGALSSAIFNPTDLIKVRMQADFGAAKGTPRYTGLVDAFRSIMNDGGIRALYKGVGPTCMRASVGAATELSTYDEIKTRLCDAGFVGHDIRGHVAASLCAGFISCAAINPIDVVKSRYMNDPSGRYSSPMDCAMKTVKTDGPMAFFRGFASNYARIGPRVVIIFVCMEQLYARFGS